MAKCKDIEQREFNRKLERLNKHALEILIYEVGMKKKYVDVLHKKYIEEKSCYEMADELNCTLESAGNLVTKSKCEIKRLIDEQEEIMSEEAQRIIKFLKNKNK